MGDQVQLNALDYIIAGILALSALAGLRQGLVQALGGLVGLLLAIAVAVIYSDDVALYLDYRLGLITWLEDFLIGRIPLTASSIPFHLSFRYPIKIEQFPSLAALLAYLSVVLGCFLFIVTIGSKLLQLVFKGFNNLLSWGILGWLNSVLGMNLVVAKNLLIIAILLSLLQAPVELAARMGLKAGVVGWEYLNSSLAVEKFSGLFWLLRDIMGVSA